LGLVRTAVAGIETNQAQRGVQLHAVAGGYQFRSNPANATWVQKLLAQKAGAPVARAPGDAGHRQLSAADHAAGDRRHPRVDSGGTLKTLMERALVRILGKKEEPGRPILYGTTKEFSGILQPARPEGSADAA